MRLAAQVDQRSPLFRDRADSELQSRIQELQSIFRRRREGLEDVISAVAVVREVARRVLGQEFYLEQLAGGLAMLDGCVIELATGEGKTLTATIPATLVGWRGRGCHIVTVNDYLAQRDAQWMGSVYRACRLTVGAVLSTTTPPERRAAYAADITYSTNKEVAADFLRDGLALGSSRSAVVAVTRALVSGAAGDTESTVMRGLPFVIVDEADSVLIDEAATPLIIAAKSANSPQSDAFRIASQLAAQLDRARDYRIDPVHREIELTPCGRSELSRHAASLDGLWRGQRRREELVVHALCAREFYLRDKHYVIRDGRIVIVDEFTGRLMPDRSWRDGFHQAVEAKEGLDPTSVDQTLARISFQRFFRLYGEIAGMSGTVLESASELWRVYQTPVVRIRTHRPCIRTRRPTRVFLNQPHKWEAVVSVLIAEHQRQRPVLVGCRAVAASESLAQRLRDRGLEVSVLNAVRVADEAQVVERAGQAGALTIATNMAGRGTDIRLGEGVVRLGGLLVIATELHESSRVDRQLFGRAGRQGDPGDSVAMVSLDDELLERYARWPGRLVRYVARLSGRREVSGWAVSWLFAMARSRAEAMNRQRRAGVTRADTWLDDALGFTGPAR